MMRLKSNGLWVGALMVFVGQPSARAQGVTVTGRVILTVRPAHGKPADSSNAVVWLTPLGESPSQDNPTRAQHGRQRYRMVQRHKRFVPHLLVVPVGSTVEFPNLDPFFHNVFSLFEGKRFDLGLYEAGATRPATFDREGVCYIFCNIHSEMSAVIVVVNTPYYGVSGREGEITIPDVLPGRYLLRVWHEASLPEFLKGLTREISVLESNCSLGTVRLTEVGSLRLTHKNKYGRDYDTPTPSIPAYNQP